MLLLLFWVLKAYGVLHDCVIAHVMCNAQRMYCILTLTLKNKLMFQILTMKSSISIWIWYCFNNNTIINLLKPLPLSLLSPPSLLFLPPSFLSPPSFSPHLPSSLPPSLPPSVPFSLSSLFFLYSLTFWNQEPNVSQHKNILFRCSCSHDP